MAVAKDVYSRRTVAYALRWMNFYAAKTKYKDRARTLRPNWEHWRMTKIIMIDETRNADAHVMAICLKTMHRCGFLPDQEPSAQQSHRNHNHRQFTQSLAPSKSDGPQKLSTKRWFDFNDSDHSFDVRSSIAHALNTHFACKNSQIVLLMHSIIDIISANCGEQHTYGIGEGPLRHHPNGLYT